jgi:hypothetical protein
MFAFDISLLFNALKWRRFLYYATGKLFWWRSWQSINWIANVSQLTHFLGPAVERVRHSRDLIAIVLMRERFSWCISPHAGCILINQLSPKTHWCACVTNKSPQLTLLSPIGQKKWFPFFLRRWIIHRIIKVAKYGGIILEEWRRENNFRVEFLNVKETERNYMRARWDPYLWRRRGFVNAHVCPFVVSIASRFIDRPPTQSVVHNIVCIRRPPKTGKLIPMPRPRISADSYQREACVFNVLKAITHDENCILLFILDALWKK